MQPAAAVTMGQPAPTHALVEDADAVRLSVAIVAREGVGGAGGHSGTYPAVSCI